MRAQDTVDARERLRRRRTEPAPVATSPRAAHERPPGHRSRAGQRARAAAVPAQRAAPLLHAHGRDHARRDRRLVRRPADLRAPLRHAPGRLAAGRRARRSPVSASARSPSRTPSTLALLCVLVVEHRRRGASTRRRASSRPGSRARGARRRCRSSPSAATWAWRSARCWRALIASQFGLGGVWLLAIPGLVIAGVQLAGLAALGGATAHARVATAFAGRDRWHATGLLLVALMVRGYVHFGLLTFIPLLEHDARHNSRAYGSRVLALMLFAGAVGTLLAGPLADRYGRRRMLTLSFLAGTARHRAVPRQRRPARPRGHRVRGRRHHLDVRHHDRALAGVPADAPLDRGRALDRPLDRPRRRRVVRDRPLADASASSTRSGRSPSPALLGAVLCALLPPPDAPQRVT